MTKKLNFYQRELQQSEIQDSLDIQNYIRLISTMVIYRQMLEWLESYIFENIYITYLILFIF